MTTTNLQSDCDALIEFGFQLEWHPYLGVAYRGPSVRLCPDQIEFELEMNCIGKRVAVWNRVTSTNDLATRASHSRANDGLVILAEEQIAGRGQRGRTWSAPPGSSILMSTLVFPGPDLVEPQWLIALAALSIIDLIEDMSIPKAKIKWPNDIRVQKRKLAGILVERGLGAVIGIGINVNLDRETFSESLRETATSLSILKEGEKLDRSELARCLIQKLDRRYSGLLQDGVDTLSDDWQKASEHVGETVALKTNNETLVGFLERLDFKSGARLVESSGKISDIALSNIQEITTI